MNQSSKNPKLTLSAWLRRNPRERIPLAAASLGMVSCLTTWLALVVVLVALDRQEGIFTVSKVLGPAFVVLTIATVALSMKVGLIKIKFGRIRIRIEDSYRPQDPFDSTPGPEHKQIEVRRNESTEL